MRFTLSSQLRRAVLTAHIIASVGLLGDSAGFTAVAIRATTTTDPDLASASYSTLDMFSWVFGIPLSVIALGTGLALGLGGKWGVLRHRWVTIKLGLVISVMLVGSFVIGPAGAAARDGSGTGELALVLAGVYDVLALALATGLSVYKPRLTRSAARRRGSSATAPAGSRQ